MKNKGLTKLEKKIQKEYDARMSAVNAGVLARAKPYDEALKSMKAGLLNGSVSSTEYRAWLRRQMITSAWSKSAADFVNGELYALNQTANKLIRNEMAPAFMFGYNTGLYEIEKGLKTGLKFNLLDKKTMERLMAENPTLLPAAREFGWGRRRVHSALVQSMLRGEGSKGLAKRLEMTVGMEKVSAIRNARTMITACENAGRIEMASEAEERGIKLEKVWLATLDERTRESHREMDGVAKPIDEPFVLTDDKGNTSELMFPADPDGDPAQVYNCRCTLIYNVNNSIESVDPNVINRRSKIENYDDWKSRHR